MGLLLVLIYLAFISLGLPDSILGTALPTLLGEFGLPLGAGSLLSLVIMGGTIVSSFFSVHIIKRVGTGMAVLVSCLMTGGALLGFSLAPSFHWLILLGVPLGLGGGTVDAALNNFVALHYEARHMNWLHSFWGVGATMGPVIMSVSLRSSAVWRQGYSSISLVQLCLGGVLVLSLPLWGRSPKREAPAPSAEASGGEKPPSPFRIRGAAYAFFIMMLYCAAEAGMGLWGSSYLSGTRGFSPDHAALITAFYFGGITAGRFLSGALTFRFSNRQLMRLGLLVVMAGLGGLLFSTSPAAVTAAAVLTGVGLAPIFPSMLHETPRRFGAANSQALMGYQMGFAYMGSTFLSPGIGMVLQLAGLAYLPAILLAAMAALALLSEALNRATP